MFLVEAWGCFLIRGKGLESARLSYHVAVKATPASRRGSLIITCQSWPWQAFSWAAAKELK